jgi:hypothetical protein
MGLKPTSLFDWHGAQTHDLPHGEHTDHNTTDAVEIYYDMIPVYNTVRFDIV